MPYNWHEPLPGFTIPRTLNASQFPDFEDFNPDLPDPLDLLVIPGFNTIPPYAWAAWSAYQRADKLPILKLDIQEAIAWRKYGTARYLALVPLWRQWMNDLAGEVDDIEDQISTIVWLLQSLGRKIVPLPPGVLNAGDNVRKTLDDLGDLLNFAGTSRALKSEWREKQRDQRARHRQARGRLAKITLWIQNNYGRLLEAAQATGTWFDVGIILGPIFGWIEDGLWSLAEKTLDNYLIAADALLPGIREDFNRNAAEITDEIYSNMEEAYEELFERSEADIVYENYFTT